MQHNPRTPIEMPRQICGRAKSAAMHDLRGQLGSGLPWKKNVTPAF